MTIEGGASGWIEITQEMIDRFARLTRDEQWIHMDVERARRESPFGSTVAHGFLTLSLMPHLLTQAVRMDGDFRLRVNYGFNRLRFVSPVPAGSRIRLHARVMQVKEIAGGREIVWEITVEREGGERPAVAAEWLSRLYY